MAQRTTGIYSILSMSWAYNLLQSALGAKQVRQRLVDEIIKPQSGNRVLDIGCGTAALLEHMPDVNYLGVDLNPRYIETARERYGSGGEFRVGAADQHTLDTPHTYDLVMAMCLLHHLDDHEVDAVFATAAKALKPGGRFVSLDCAFVEKQNPIARLIIKCDRGATIRSPEKLARLAQPHFQTVETVVRHDLLRVPYTHVILQCVNEQCRTEPIAA